MLPDLLNGHQGAHLVVRVDGQVILDGPQAVLVSNNPYETGDIAGLGRRARLDQGVLGVVGVKIETAAQAAGLLRRAQRSRSVTVLTAREVIIDADQPQIPVGIDGESVLMPTPVRCTIRPLSLRVRVPRDRPGVPEPRPPMDWARLRRPGAHLHPDQGRRRGTEGNSMMAGTHLASPPVASRQISGKFPAASPSACSSRHAIDERRCGGAALSRLVSECPYPQQHHRGPGTRLDEIIQCGPQVVIPGWERQDHPNGPAAVTHLGHVQVT